MYWFRDLEGQGTASVSRATSGLHSPWVGGRGQSHHDKGKTPKTSCVTQIPRRCPGGPYSTGDSTDNHAGVKGITVTERHCHQEGLNMDICYTDYTAYFYYVHTRQIHRYGSVDI